VVDQDVLHPRRGEDVAAEFANAFREARFVWLEQQIRAAIGDQL
jgi:hypothetical protein